jgi:hypothetical protein
MVTQDYSILFKNFLKFCYLLSNKLINPTFNDVFIKPSFQFLQKTKESVTRISTLFLSYYFLNCFNLL